MPSVHKMINSSLRLILALNESQWVINSVWTLPEAEGLGDKKSFWRRHGLNVSRGRNSPVELFLLIMFKKDAVWKRQGRHKKWNWMSVYPHYKKKVWLTSILIILENRPRLLLFVGPWASGASSFKWKQTTGLSAASARERNRAMERKKGKVH